MISIVFATFNGAQTLPRMLGAFESLDLPPGGLEIIAADNGSTDGTSDILRDFAGRLPLTRVECPARGKNRALNAAVERIRGELVVLTDDDIIPDRRWLHALTEAAQRHPDVNVFGGAIRLAWPSPPPLWITEHVNLGVVYAQTPESLGDEEIAPGLIWGPNMMVRAKIFHDGLRFDESIGPAGGNYVMGSETEFIRRAHRLGNRCRFVPDAIVEHIVRPQQMELDWILGRAIRIGKSEYHQYAEDYRRRFSTLFGIPRWMITRAARDLLIAFARGWKRRPQSSFEYLWYIYRFLGFVQRQRELGRSD